jgi:hypothetical protein
MCGWGVCLSDCHIAVWRMPQQVSVPCLEVQMSIRKRDWRCREGKERRHDTRTHGQEQGGWCNMACFAARRSLFSLVQNRVQPAWEMKDDGFVHVVATKKGERKEKR